MSSNDKRKIPDQARRALVDSLKKWLEIRDDILEKKNYRWGYYHKYWTFCSFCVVFRCGGHEMPCPLCKDGCCSNALLCADNKNWDAAKLECEKVILRIITVINYQKYYSESV